MANEVTITVSTRDKTAAGFASVKRGLRGVEDSIKSLNREFDRLDVSSERSRHELDRVADVDFSGVRRKLAEINAEIRAIPNRVEIDVDIDKRSHDKVLSKASGMAADVGQKFSSIFAQSFTDFSGVLGKALSAGGPAVQAALIGIAATAAVGMAEVIAGALISGILLALGGSVLALGIAGAMGAPEVKSAAGRFGELFRDKDPAADQKSVADLEKKLKDAQARLKKAQTLGEAKAIRSAQYDIDLAQKDLKKARDQLDKTLDFNNVNISVKDLTKPFVEPLARAIDTFAEKTKELMPRIAAVFERMAPLVDKLAPALAELVDKAWPGIEAALTASIPFFEKLAEHMPEIGKAISDFFTAIAIGGPSALRIFEGILQFIEWLIPAIGIMLATMSNEFMSVIDAWHGGWLIIQGFVSGAISGIGMIFRAVVQVILSGFGFILDAAVRAFGWIPGLGDKLRAAQADFNRFRDNVNNALDGIHDEEVVVRVRTIGTAVGGVLGIGTSVGFHAAGGVAGGMSVVNDGLRPEAIKLPQGSMVYPNANAAPGGYGNAAGAGPMPEVRVIIDLVGADSELKKRIRKMTRVEGGKGSNSVQLAWGS